MDSVGVTLVGRDPARASLPGGRAPTGVALRFVHEDEALQAPPGGAGPSLVVLLPDLEAPEPLRARLLAEHPHAVVIAWTEDLASDRARALSRAGVAVADASGIAAVLSLLGGAHARTEAALAAVALTGAAFAAVDGAGRPQLRSENAEALGLGPAGEALEVTEEHVTGDPSSPAASPAAPRPLRLRVGLDDEHERVVERRTAALGEAGTITVHRDVTDLDVAERLVLEHGRAEAAAVLARGVVHDLNNAFCVISSFADLLLDATEEDDPRHEDILEIARAGARASALTGRLVAFSRATPTRSESVNLSDLLRRADPLLKRALGEEVELAVGFPATDATALCDPTALEQVLVGLVGRFKREAGRGGVISVTLGDEEDWVRIDISALPGEQGPDVARGKEDAGLASAAIFASRYGGKLDVGPSSASLSLPAAERRAPAQRVPTAKVTRKGREVVLVVEDETSVRTAISRLLSSLGYEILEARRGEDARHLSARCDIVLADMVLPGQSGLELVRALRKDRPELPALLITGYAPDEATLGVAVVHKPFTAVDLARRVRRALDGE